MRRPGLLWMIAASIATLAMAPSTRAQSTDDLRPEVLDTIFRMRVLAAAVDTRAVENGYPGPTAGLVPASSLGGQLLARARSAGGAVRDAWNNPILYWSDGHDYLLLSLGSDGARQFDYGGATPYASIPVGWAGTDPTNDLLIVDGAVYRGPASQTELLRRTMVEMRMTGTACESFAVDNNVYPGPVAPADGLARIASDLEPLYIRVLPKLDPWGNPYLFWSDTQHDAVISYGVDGVPDYPYAQWGLAEFNGLHTGATTHSGQDIVWVTGTFVQWPKVVQGP